MAGLLHFFTNAGIPQGSVLWPTLLLAFINDRPDVESAGELELDLRSIVKWGDRWLVTFDATKTKLLSFNRHKRPSFGDCGDEWH